MIYCIGRNYPAHAKEMNSEVPKDNPIVFFKPPASVALSGQKIFLPKFSQDVQYEVELAFRFDGKMEAGEICVANDLTARDKQRQAAEARGPWALAKGFKQSCGLGNWVPSENIDLTNLELTLTLNGELKQRGFTKDMVYKVPDLIKFLRETFPVNPGDIVLTGSPAGVGRIKTGDVVVAEITGYSRAQWNYE